MYQLHDMKYCQKANPLTPRKTQTVPMVGSPAFWCGINLSVMVTLFWLNFSQLCKHYSFTFSQLQKLLNKVQSYRSILSSKRNWPKKKVLVARKHITLYDIPACSQKLPWTLLCLYLDQRSPRATCMSEQMGLINHLIVSFPCAISSSSAEKPYLCCIRGDCANQNAIFQVKYIATSNYFITFLYPFSAQFYDLAISFPLSSDLYICITHGGICSLIEVTIITELTKQYL